MTLDGLISNLLCRWQRKFSFLANITLRNLEKLRFQHLYAASLGDLGICISLNILSDMNIFDSFSLTWIK